MQHSMRVLASTDSIYKRATPDESDEEFWERMQREYPGQQNTSPFLYSPDQAGESFDEPDAPLPVDDDWEDILPRNTSLAEHAHLLRNGYRWDDDERYPKYERDPIWRSIVDSDGLPASAKEGHVIERNTHVMHPVLSEELRPMPLAHPWMHTYYPAGVRDEEGLSAGYNTAQAATRAATQLALWGTRHPESQALLRNYRYVGNESPYDPSVELPHEAARVR